MTTWRQMERLVDLGLVRSIGMSNMTITKLEQVLPLCRIKPTVLEVEINPTFQQPKLFEYCKAHDIQLIAFSPMGSPCRPERDTEEGDVVTFELPELKKIAEAHCCHPATVCVKWAVQRGQIPIPFSIFEKEYVGNLKCTTEDFLSGEEMEILRKADKNARLIKGRYSCGRMRKTGGISGMVKMNGILCRNRPWNLQRARGSCGRFRTDSGCGAVRV